MTTELTVLAWGCILALVHVFAAGNAKTKQYGAKWNMGPRDGELPPPNPLVGRLMRAQANFFETFPLLVAAVLIVAVAGLSTRWTAIGAIVWLVARVIYLPLYAAGIPGIRSVAFLVSLVGLLMVLWPALF
ncbi:MAPEG family protein [Sphingobium sufflavum]|uniref:MAPEG family protein n=1 Tax=Sphingobium sufflavum TaxID=1129547 RepID=UPI001F1A0A0E|nr:MAPEG family protein [Sphingobium sufflavum]MCE7795109.1 MAPEG family protein [Sphingobium sufflavum]